VTHCSFAIVIQQLPEQLRDAVCVFYLVLRALDTVEDDMAIPQNVKVPVLRSFHEKISDRYTGSLSLALSLSLSLSLSLYVCVCVCVCVRACARALVCPSLCLPAPLSFPTLSYHNDVAPNTRRWQGYQAGRATGAGEHRRAFSQWVGRGMKQAAGQVVWGGITTCGCTSRGRSRHGQGMMQYGVP
jgi:hypothetical protein